MQTFIEFTSDKFSFMNVRSSRFSIQSMQNGIIIRRLIRNIFICYGS